MYFNCEFIIITVLIYFSSILKRTVRNQPLQISGQNWWLRVGGHSGHPDHGQNAKTPKRRLRQLRHKVSDCFDKRNFNRR